jgi:ornithine cyclodeaminase
MSEKTKVEFLYLSEEDMIEAGVLDAGKCVDVMGEVVSLLSEGDYLMGGKDRNAHGIMLNFPLESDIEDFPLNDSRDRRFMAMPAYLGGRFHLAGQKWYGSNGRNVQKGLPRSILMVTLNDVETGQPLAYMSANLLSAMRTGAMPGLAAKYLTASKTPEVVSLIGPGVVNKTCLMAYMALYPSIHTVKIKGSTPTSKTAQSMKEFIEKEFPSIKNIEICATLEEAVKEADIVSEAVSVEKKDIPVFQPEWFKKGALVITSGSMHLDRNFMNHSVTKVVDNYGMYEQYLEDMTEEDKYDKETGKKNTPWCPGCVWAEDVMAGRMEKESIQTLGGIVRGIEPGRTSEDELIIVNVGGMPILDVGWGYECYKTALERGIGTKLKVWDTPFLA